MHTNRHLASWILSALLASGDAALAVASEPDSPVASAQAAIEQGDLDAAERIYLRVLDAARATELGMVPLATGEYGSFLAKYRNRPEDALRLYEEGIRALDEEGNLGNEDEASLRFLAAESNEFLGRLNEALAEAKAALRIRREQSVDPELTARSLIQVASIAGALQQEKLKESSLREAIELLPEERYGASDVLLEASVALERLLRDQGRREAASDAEARVARLLARRD